MLNRRGQANIIVVLGMVAATIFVLFNAFNYITYVGLSSQIETTAQTSIYQSLAQKDYLVQQANYLFDKAQLFDAFNLQPSSQSVSCGYINASSRLPFIPVDKIYYWRNLAGDTCLPNNEELVFGLEQLLNQSQFGMVNASGLDITSYLDLNLTKTAPNIFMGNFSAPYLGDLYTITYNSSNAANIIVDVYDNNKSYYVFNGTIGAPLNLNGSQFIINPTSDIISGVLSQTVAKSNFFVGANLAPDAQFSIVTFPSGTEAVIYDSRSGGQPVFNMTPLIDPNVYNLNSAITKDIQAGVAPQIELVNNSIFNFDGTWYNFTVTNYPNGVFSISPVNYTILPLQPQFVYYKYLINQFQTSAGQNILFPNNKQLSVSLSLFPLYNPQVCASYNQVQFTLTNCISVSGYITTNDYISKLMQIGVAFVNNSFPIGNGNVEGFAQYALDDYLSNAAHVVNLKTVSVNGQPKYDWFSAMMLALGSPNGAAYLLNQLSKVKEPYYGTTVYNCSQNSSDMQFCRNLLSQTVSADIRNLFDTQVPIELGFLAGTPFDINVLNLSANLTELDTCPSYGGYSSRYYNATVGYSFSIKAPNYTNFSKETIGLPISLDFGYQNELNLSPSEPCGIQNDPYGTGYPGFSQTLVSSSKTYLNCAPIQAKQFLNSTCIATVDTSNTAVEKFITSNGGVCQSVSGTNYYSCSGYQFNNFDTSQPYGYFRWFTQGNACPSYVVIDQQNFTYSQSPSQYKLVLMQGGGTVKPNDNYSSWSFVSANGSALNLPQNISVYTGVVLSGPNPSFNLLLSQHPNLEEGFSYAQLISSGSQNSVFTYDTSGSSIAASSQSSAAPNILNNVQVNVYGSKTSGYNLTFYSNGAKLAAVSNISGWSKTGFNSVHLIGLSTDNLPTQDYISYLFVTNYIKGYTPINTLYPSEQATTLNPGLITAFGISDPKSTYYNIVSLNNVSVSNSSQLELILGQNFDYAALSVFPIQVFGTYTSGAIKQLYWWNQTSLQSGGILWVNLSNRIPQSLYIVYGSGANTKNEYADNGSHVFPLFFSNTTGNIPSIFNHQSTVYPSPIPKVSVSGVTLTKLGPVYPFIYNSSLSSYYGQFACITIKPSLSITVLNATYSPYSQISTVTSFNPLYPDFNILNAKLYNNWGSVGS